MQGTHIKCLQGLILTHGTIAKKQLSWHLLQVHCKQFDLRLELSDIHPGFRITDTLMISTWQLLLLSVQKTLLHSRLVE